MTYPTSDGVLKVLHVEDNPMDAELCASTIKTEWPRAEITRVESAEEMAAVLPGHQFNLVLSDMSMPRFNGLLALRMLREVDPATPFIFVSGTIGEDNAVQALHDGATDYVLKDRAAKLVPAIKRALGEVRALKDRRESMRQLQEQAEYMAKARDAIVVTGMDRKITYWNHAAEKILGYTASETLGKKSDEVFSPLDRGTISQVRRDSADKDSWAGECELHAKDGHPVALDVTLTVIRDDAGMPKALLSISADITEKRLMMRQSLQAQRVESIGILAGGIAHDLNNVLTPILMSATLMQMKVADPDIQRLSNIIHTSAQRGADLIRQVLVFARGGEGEKAEIELKPVANEVVALLRQTLPRSIEIELGVAEGLPKVRTDATQLSQVLMNLGVNARDAMIEGGKLSIRVAEAMVSTLHAQQHPNAKPGRYVRITVTDTGSGIPAEVRDKIFDPFFTTKAPGKGTGLGLSTVMGIVRNHEGFVEVDSEVGKGTEFRIYLPVVEEAKVSPALAAPAVAPRGTGEMVLVVDDEPAIRDTLANVLEANGYRAAVAVDGAEALKLYAARPADFSVVVTDMMMPGMQGEELIAQLRAVNPSVRVVAITGVLTQGKDLPEERRRLKFVLKPMQVPALLEAVAAMIRQAA
jgi:two-component system cell cycle sensor histidine kinase/response regulator CckA